MRVRDIDHLTITVKDLDRTMRFYHEVLDLPVVSFTKKLLTVQLGHQKLEFRQADMNYNPNIPHATPGASAFCITDKDSLTYTKEHLANYGVKVVRGPVEVRGSNGPMRALWILDPDSNLIEIKEAKQTKSFN
ncbi:MAG: hypothetical protein AJITA_00206 [Acetilactobacillus jinshanensis]